MLGATGAGSVLLLAGCLGPDDGDDEDPEAEEGNGQDIEDEERDAGEDDPEDGD